MLEDPQRQPLAFISHSSADKERIARPLDELLRARGFRTWLDERDLLPGRNLVDEIFSQGIAKSDIFIAVLTANSIDSKWVHEELTNAVVQRIDGIVKMIIPVIVDDVTPPDYLKQTVWERVTDPTKLPMNADRIAASVFGQRPAPSAPPPAYAGMPVHRLPGLTHVDVQIFAAAGEQIFDPERAFDHSSVNFRQLLQFGMGIGMTEAQVAESLQVLEQRGFFDKVIHGFGEPHPSAGRMSHTGMEMYLQYYRPEVYRAAKLAVLSQIVNHNARSSAAIVLASGVHAAIVKHVLHDLHYVGHINARDHSEGISFFAKPSVVRVFRELEAGH